MKVVCGIWVPCDLPAQDPLSGMSTVWSVNITPDTIKGCSFAGKSIVLGSNIFSHEVLGHNLHHIAAFDYVEERSFGRLFVMHVKLPPVLKGRRSLKKVLAHFNMTINDETLLQEKLMEISQAEEVPLNIRDYAKEYLTSSGKDADRGQPSIIGKIEILSDDPQHLPLLSGMVDDIDFQSFIQTSRDIVSSWPASQGRSIRDDSK